MANQEYITFDKSTLESLSPDEAITILKDGNKRFVDQKNINRDYQQQISKTANGQAPFAVVLSCIDSRVPTEIVFDQGIGDIFNIRIAGNIVNEDILGSMEFACKLVGSKVILVLGHTRCGAVKGAYNDAKLGNLTGLLEKIGPAVKACEGDQQQDEKEHLDNISKKNVELVIQEISKKSSVLSELIDQGTIKVIGGMYDVTNGKVELL